MKLKSSGLLLSLAITLAACGQTQQPTEQGRLRSGPTTQAPALLQAQASSLTFTAFGGAATGTNTYNATSLASALVGPGVTVSNATFKGARAATALFGGGTPSVGFASGVILSTGPATSFRGPNTVTATQGDAAENFDQVGDTQLLTLARQAATAAGSPQPTSTRDAAALEFDFVPQGDLVYFNYVFASEEYDEWINTQYNDVFGFFINGQNCALVPSPGGTGQVPVSVNTVNASRNAALFRPNTTAGPLLAETSADGLTTTLTCAVTVTPNAVNHAKLAIADGSDPYVNSFVMIQAGSFSTSNANAPELTLPGNQTIEATAPTMTVPYTVTATDVQDGDLTSRVQCTPTSALTLAVGESSTVTCSVTDSGGLTSRGSFTVRVVDTTPPALNLPAPQTLNATNAQGAVATFTATATDLGQDVPVTCTPASGSVFGFGTTTVTCTATDAQGLTSTGTFTVTVNFLTAGGFFKDGWNDVKKVGSTWPMKVLPPNYADGRVATDLADGLTVTLNGQVTPGEWTWNGQFYESNLKTKGMQVGQYDVRVAYHGVEIARNTLTLR